MKEDKILSALVGLVGATMNEGKKENTDRTVISALAYPLRFPDCSDTDIDGVVELVNAEKSRVAPGCATCAMHCGNTDNYDLERFYSADEETRELKTQIIELAERKALKLQDAEATSIPVDELELIYKAIAYFSFDLESTDYKQLIALLEEDS